MEFGAKNTMERNSQRIETMNSKNKLKKLLIDIIIPVVIFALIGCALYIEQQGFRLPSNADESLLIDEDAWYAVQNPNAGAIASNAPKCLIVFDKNDDDSIALKNNIEYVLNSINVSRGYESMSNILKTQSDTLQQAISLGNIAR